MSQLITEGFQFDLSSPPTAVLRTRGHRFSVTSATASESGRFLFTAGKEGSIIKWDLSSGKKVSTFHKQRPSHLDKGKGKAQPDDEVKGHTDEVLALALSSDGKYLASGGKDRRVCVWDADKSEWIKSFKGPMCHRDTVSVCSPFYPTLTRTYSLNFTRRCHSENRLTRYTVHHLTVRSKFLIYHLLSWGMSKRSSVTRIKCSRWTRYEGNHALALVLETKQSDSGK